jgi:effector-binding domain-containing protein
MPKGISVRELKGGRAVTLIHKGPYENLGGSYKNLFDYIHQKKKIVTLLPTREIYWKGPGMILKGNPKNYLTELQVMIEEKNA